MMTATAAQAAGVTSFLFSPSEARPLCVYAIVPPGLSARTRLAVVLHGTRRNGAEYAGAWTGWAASSDHVVLVPEFDRKRWPGGRSYQLGNVFSRSRARGTLLPEGRWAYTAVEELVAEVRARLGLAEDTYALWGHSAGAQFVHRFLLFRPRARVHVAFVTGCGWFTLPDLAAPFPYGLRHPLLRFGDDDVRRFLRRPIVVMRAEHDTVRDAHLRTTRLAEAQGRNRFERAAYAFGLAHSLDRECRWRLVTVPDVGHDGLEMARATQELWPR
jgi:poly(3-hydroxybutyrate) depolymerase